MKKYIFTITIAAVMVFAAGCAGIYGAFQTDATAVHDAAVAKITEYAETALNKKIDNSENLSEAGKAELKAEVAKLKVEILERIARIKAKTETGE